MTWVRKGELSCVAWCDVTGDWWCLPLLPVLPFVRHAPRGEKPAWIARITPSSLHLMFTGGFSSRHLRLFAFLLLSSTAPVKGSRYFVPGCPFQDEHLTEWTKFGCELDKRRRLVSGRILCTGLLTLETLFWNNGKRWTKDSCFVIVRFVEAFLKNAISTTEASTVDICVNKLPHCVLPTNSGSVYVRAWKDKHVDWRWGDVRPSSRVGVSDGQLWHWGDLSAGSWAVCCGPHGIPPHHSFRYMGCTFLSERGERSRRYVSNAVVSWGRGK